MGNYCVLKRKREKEPPPFRHEGRNKTREGGQKRGGKEPRVLLPQRGKKEGKGTRKEKETPCQWVPWGGGGGGGEGNDVLEYSFLKKKT